MKIQIAFKKGKLFGTIVCDSMGTESGNKFIAYFHQDKEKTVRVYSGKIVTCFPVQDNEYYIDGDARSLEISL